MGNTNNTYGVPRWSAPMMISSCEDETLTAGTDGNYGVDYQLHVRVFALGDVPIGTYNLDVVVEG